jgi:hypothetical protein
VLICEKNIWNIPSKATTDITAVLSNRHEYFLSDLILFTIHNELNIYCLIRLVKINSEDIS